MKYLLNQSFKAIRRGAFVSANTQAGEFIFDSEDEKNCPKIGPLMEIDKANNLEVLAKYKKDKITFLNQIHQKLGDLKMPEQNQETQTNKAADIIKKLHSEGKTQEDMTIALIGAGLKFSQISKLLKSELTKLGAIISPKERKEKGFEILTESNFNPQNAEDVLAAAAKIESNVPQTDTGKAMVVIRAYAKEKGIELPKKVKGATNIRLKVFNYMIESPNATKEQFKEFMEALNRNEKTINRYWEVFEIAQKMAAVLSGSKAA